MSFTHEKKKKKQKTRYLKYKHHELYINENVTIWQELFVLVWTSRKTNGAQQFETDDISWSELVAYQFWPHRWNFCPISVLMVSLQNRVGDFSIFLSSFVIYLSSLLVKIFYDTHWVGGQAITEFSRVVFQVSLRTKFERQSVLISSKKAHSRKIQVGLLLLSKFSQQFTPLSDHYQRSYVNTHAYPR